MNPSPESKSPELAPIAYVSGPLHSGKTTRLRQWCEGRSDVGGVFQPVIEGKRYLIDIHTSDKMPMEVGLEDDDAWTIGTFRFSIAAFVWAAERIRAALADPAIHYVIIDEVGPLEMCNLGLDSLLESILETPVPDKQIILVIRDYLLEEVLGRYDLRGEPFTNPEGRDAL